MSEAAPRMNSVAFTMSQFAPSISKSRVAPLSKLRYATFTEPMADVSISAPNFPFAETLRNWKFPAASSVPFLTSEGPEIFTS